MTTLKDLAEEAISHGSIQKPRELIMMGYLARTWGLNTMLEIGTMHGWTAWFFSQLGIKVTAVDIDLSQVTVVNNSIRFIQASSMEVAPTLGNFDLIFIDGDHSYEGVKADWNTYCEKTNPQGFVAFHDIVDHPPETGCEVHRLWNELRTGGLTISLIDALGGRDWAGIGVVPC